MRISFEIPNFKEERDFKVYRLFNEFNRQENSIVFTLNKKHKEIIEKMNINGLSLVLIRIPNAGEEFEVKYVRNSISREIDNFSDSHTYIVLAQRNHNAKNTHLFVYYALKSCFEKTRNIKLKEGLLKEEIIEFNSSKSILLLKSAEKIYSDMCSILNSEGVVLNLKFSNLREAPDKKSTEPEYLEFKLKKPFSASVLMNGFKFIIPKGSRIEIPKSKEMIENLNSMILDSVLKVNYRSKSLIEIENKPFSIEDEIIANSNIELDNITSALRLLIGKNPSKKYYEYFEDGEEIIDFIEYLKEENN